MDKYESKYFNTAKKMDDALIDLLQEKSFDYITVKDICTKAKVSRSTFYLHYLGLADLLEEVIGELNNSFKDAFKNNQKDNFLSKKDNFFSGKEMKDLYLITDEYLVPYLEFIKKNKNIFKAIRENPQLFYTDRVYKKMFKNIFSPILTRYGVSADEHEYMMEFYIKGIGAVIMTWIDRDCKDDITKICDIIKKCINVRKEDL